MTVFTSETIHDHARTVVEQLDPGLLVRVARVALESQTPQGGDLDVEGQLSVNVGLDEGTRALACAVTYHLTATAQSQPPVTMWDIELEINGQWAVASTDGLTDDHLRAFAMKVGLMALHPYARAHIQSAVTTTGWPPYALDVITTPDALFGADDAGTVDLEGISVSRKG